MEYLPEVLPNIKAANLALSSQCCKLKTCVQVCNSLSAAFELGSFGFFEFCWFWMILVAGDCSALSGVVTAALPRLWTHGPSSPVRDWDTVHAEYADWANTLKILNVLKCSFDPFGMLAVLGCLGCIVVYWRKIDIDIHTIRHVSSFFHIFRYQHTCLQ